MIQRRRERLCVRGGIHQPELQRRHDRNPGAHEQHRDRDHPCMPRGDAEEAQHDDVPNQHTADGAHQRAVGEPRSGQVTQDHAHAEHGEHQRNVTIRNPGDPRERGCDVAQHTE